MRFLSLFLYLLFSQFSIGQLSVEDSLLVVSYKNTLVSNQPDSSKINAYADWATLIEGLDFELEKQLLNSLDSICDVNLKRNLSKKEAKFFKKKKADCIFDLGDLYRYNFEYKKALDYFEISKALYIELEEDVKLAALLNNEGLLHAEIGDYAKSLNNYEQSIELFKAAKDSNGWANSLSNIAIISANMGNYDQAITYFTQCMTIDERMGYTEGVASGLNNIGVVYTDFGKYDKALDYFERGYQMRVEQENLNGQAVIKGNIGGVYFLMDSIELSLKYYEEALLLSRQIQDKVRMMEALNGIGENYIMQARYVESRSYLEEALAIGQELENDYNVSSIYVNVAKSYAGTGEYKKAINLAQKSLELGTEIGVLNLVRDASEMLYVWNKKIGNNSQALIMHEVFINTRDSINREENQMEIINQEYKYSYEKQKALDDVENEKQKLLEKARTDAALLVEKEKEQQQKILIYAISVGLLLVVGFLVILFNRLKLTRRQKDEIDAQKSAIDLQHRELAATHKDMRDSIHYAKYLQSAILPSLEEIGEYLGSHFILYKPKDVISGDFYWFEHINGVNYIAAADCTGHGVPGAMLCVVCSNALNQSVNEFGLKAPNEILDNARKIVIETLGKKGAVRDGMDISLGALYEDKIVFSGANNPLWISRKKELLTDDELEKKGTLVRDDLALLEFKGDKQPVGLYSFMKDFTQIEVPLLKGDRLYFFSDGYIDQFGGEKGKKFKSRPFKSLILDTANLSVEAQKEHLAITFENWKGQIEQVDDVCIIGIQI
ncbi:MAG: tetratricopeptide repeat protein [Crocinitomix sp.]|nr:tetratricopeptide repeat protein [Crocinitomix sp.]